MDSNCDLRMGSCDCNGGYYDVCGYECDHLNAAGRPLVLWEILQYFRPAAGGRLATKDYYSILNIMAESTRYAS